MRAGSGYEVLEISCLKSKLWKTKSSFGLGRRRVRICLSLLAATLLVATGLSVPAVQAADYKPGQLLVGFESGTTSSQRAAVHDDAGAEVEGRLAKERVDVVDLPPGQSVGEAAEIYERDPRVAFAEPNYRLETFGTPDDPFYVSGDLWWMASTHWAEGVAQLPSSATQGTPWPSYNVTVGIIDSGIDATHPDLAGQAYTKCWVATGGNGSVTSGSPSDGQTCKDENSHGTHVSGTIAALANNGAGVAGGAPGAKIAMCKAINKNGSGYTIDVARCIDTLTAEKTAGQPVTAISMSLGGSYSRTLETAINSAYSAGITVVASAGNSGDNTVNYPAALPNVVGVGATDRDNQRASFSSYGAGVVSVMAGGVGIISTVPGGGYASSNGTSMASPQVAALIALLVTKNGTQTPSQIRTKLQDTADNLGAPGRDDATGYGLINFCRALGGSSCGSASTSASQAPTAAFTMTPDSSLDVDETITVDASSSSDDSRISSYAWDFDSDGRADATGQVAQVGYASAGSYKITLRVTDDSGATGTTEKTIQVGTVTSTSTQQLRASGKVPTRLSLKQALKRGIKVACTVGGPATCGVKIQLAAKAAKRVGLKAQKGSRYVTLGSNETIRDSAGTSSLTVLLSKRAKPALKKLKRVRLYVSFVATDESGNTMTVHRQLTLSGPKVIVHKKR